MKSEHPVITIGREYGSGGHAIGKNLAEKLNIPFYDKEILTLAAKESGICEDLFEHYDEKTAPSYLFSLATAMDFPLGFGSGALNLPLNHRVFLAQFETITKLASQGACVIVGRCGDYVLKDHPHVLSVFIYASAEKRMERIMSVEGLAHDKAKELIRKVDKQRQSYYSFYADGNWGQRRNYDLMLCTDGLTPADAADVILAFASKKRTS